METTEAGALESPRLPPDTSRVTDQPAELDEFVYPAEDEAHSRCLEGFAVGWHARDDEISGLVGKLAAAEADRDRYYRHAYDTAESLAGRLDEGAEIYWRDFLEAE